MKYLLNDNTVIKNSIITFENEKNQANDDVNKIRDLIVAIADLIKIASNKPEEFIPTLRDFSET